MKQKLNLLFLIIIITQTLEKVESYKYLGVDITSDLNMNPYVNNVYKKANYKVYMFSKIRKYITRYAAIMIYKQTILPYMDYCSFVMDSACQYSLSKLDKIQKRSARLIEYRPRKDREEDVNTLLRAYRIQPIRDRRIQQLLCFIYQESKNPLNLNKKITNLVLRSDSKINFKEKLTRKTVIMNSPYYRAISAWNNLAEDIQKADSLVKFKGLIKPVTHSRPKN